MGQPKHKGKRAVAKAKARQKRELEKAGVKAKIDRVLFACSSAEFQGRFSAAADRAGDAITDNKLLRDLVHQVLDDMAIPREGVNLTFTWDPSERKLGIYFRPENALADVARAALAAVPPAPSPP